MRWHPVLAAVSIVSKSEDAALLFLGPSGTTCSRFGLGACNATPTYPACSRLFAHFWSIHAMPSVGRPRAAAARGGRRRRSRQFKGVHVITRRPPISASSTHARVWPPELPPPPRPRAPLEQRPWRAGGPGRAVVGIFVAAAGPARGVMWAPIAPRSKLASFGATRCQHSNTHNKAGASHGVRAAQGAAPSIRRRARTGAGTCSTPPIDRARHPGRGWLIWGGGGQRGRQGGAMEGEGCRAPTSG